MLHTSVKLPELCYLDFMCVFMCVCVCIQIDMLHIARTRTCTCTLSTAKEGYIHV